jgi:hypothetical protein
MITQTHRDDRIAIPTARLLLIGVSGMDWRGFDAKTRRGTLKHLAELRRRGVAGWLDGAPDGAGPAAWASLATGRRPEDHGVWRREEAWAGGLRPTSRASWRAPPLWDTLAEAGVATGSAAWPASRPGAAGRGMHIDDGVIEASDHVADTGALPRSGLPDRAREVIRDLRVRPSDITTDMLKGLAPRLDEIDQARDATLPTLAAAMAEAATAQASAVWLLQDGAAQALFAHQPWLGKARGLLDDYRGETHAGMIDGAWRLLDILVGRLAAVATADTLVVVVSPGWRGSPGVVLAAGPGVVDDEAFTGADLLDIAPTILARFGLRDDTLPGCRLAPLGGPSACREAPRAELAAPPAADRRPPARRGTWGFPPRLAVAGGGGAGRSHAGGLRLAAWDAWR